MTLSAVLVLPLPPSINTYWRANGNRRFICEAGKQFRRDVEHLVKVHKIESFAEKRLHMSVRLHMRDRRATDLDNRIKALWDALQHAGVYKDDSQIDSLTVVRGEIIKGGKCLVRVEEFIS